VDRFAPRTSFVWNTVPGAMSVCPEYSQSLADFPFYWRAINYKLEDSYTAVIYATNASLGGATVTTPLHRLIKVLSKTNDLNKVCIYKVKYGPIYIAAISCSFTKTFLEHFDKFDNVT